MPHLTIEYSANLDGRADMRHLCDRLLQAVLYTGLFEVGAVRVRAVRCEHYAVADGDAENGFVDLNLRIGAGRSPEEKKKAGEAILASAEGVLAALLAGQHFALSLEVREIDPDLSWKRNSMHQRLRKPNS